jgi:hypothetical protein
VISFSVFNILPADMQADMLFNSGIYLELVRKTSQLNIELYALEHFYVEVYYDNSTEDALFLRAFESTKELEPYLSMIPVRNMFNPDK